MSRYSLELTEERHYKIKSEISSRYNLGWSTVESRSRKRVIVDARRLYCGLLRNLFGLTFHEIANILNKNHATIIHNINKHDIFVKILKSYKKNYEEIESSLMLGDNYYEHEVISVERKMNELSERLNELIEKKNEYKLKIKKQKYGRQELCSK
jgi:formyltetrahydrofolate hydrolase|tara:strand:- start:17 stop:478 length:462 start_codon:yes stop_codon:yes gene_type:complete